MSSLLWLAGFAVRSLHAVDLAPVMYSHDQPGTRMARRYDEAALALLAGDGILYPRVWPDPSDTALLSRPPGYPLFIAAVYRAGERSAFAVQLVQGLLGAFLPVLLFQLGTALCGLRVGVVAGVMAAGAAPLAWHCGVVTPDSLASLAAVAVVALLWRDRWRPGWATIGAGFLMGAATWLRPNFVFMALFVALGLVVASPCRRRAAPWAFGMAAAAILAVIPVTLRNWRLYHAFVPVSSNMGILLWEGIADAGGERFGARSRDPEVANEEARHFGEPRYAAWWASPDGIRRDRARVRRSLEVIQADPVWFGAAAIRRMAEMLDYGRGDGEFVRPTGEGPGERPPGLTPGEAAMRAAGRPAAFARPPVAILQRVLASATLPLAAVGLGTLLVLSKRRLVFLALVPLYHLITQAPLHYEPRYILPMQGFVLVFAAAGAIGTVLAVLRLSRKGG